MFRSGSVFLSAGHHRTQVLYRTSCDPNYSHDPKWDWPAASFNVLYHRTKPNWSPPYLLSPTYYPFLPIISSYHSPVIHQSIPSPNHKLDNSHKAKLDLPGQTLLFDQLKDISHSVPFSLLGRYRSSLVTPSFQLYGPSSSLSINIDKWCQTPFPVVFHCIRGWGEERRNPSVMGGSLPRLEDVWIIPPS